MANKDKVQSDVRGNNKPLKIKRIRQVKSKSNLLIIKEISNET